MQDAFTFKERRIRARRVKKLANVEADVEATHTPADHRLYSLDMLNDMPCMTQFLKACSEMFSLPTKLLQGEGVKEKAVIQRYIAAVVLQQQLAAKTPAMLKEDPAVPATLFGLSTLDMQRARATYAHPHDDCPCIEMLAALQNRTADLRFG